MDVSATCLIWYAEDVEGRRFTLAYPLRSRVCTGD